MNFVSPTSSVLCSLFIVFMVLMFSSYFFLKYLVLCGPYRFIDNEFYSPFLLQTTFLSHPIYGLTADVEQSVYEDARAGFYHA